MIRTALTAAVWILLLPVIALGVALLFLVLRTVIGMAL